MKLFPLIAVCAITAGCASSGVVPMDRGTLMISKDSAKFGGGISQAVRVEVYQEANAYCAKTGQEMETQDLMMEPGRVGQLGNVTLQFRCVAAGSGKSGPVKLQRTPDQVIEVRQR